MAETIARQELLDAGLTPERFEVGSAGLAAGPGMPMTPEAEAALIKLGYEPRAHRSRGLTLADMERADEIYGMTGAHVQAMRQALPHCADKIRLLDPSGADVPDPFASPPEVYDTTCRKLVELIRHRLGTGAERSHQ